MKFNQIVTAMGCCMSHYYVQAHYNENNEQFFFLHELRLDSTFPRSSRRSLCGWRIKKGISMTQGITNGSIFINHWHVMCYKSTHASRVYLLLQIVLIPSINIIRYIEPHSLNSYTSVITWDSIHLSCFACASLLF